MIYLIQVTLYTAALYLVYLLFLKNKADHNWSRAYLLLNMAVPFILPLISIPVYTDEGSVANTVVLPVITVGADMQAKASALAWLPAIYICVSCVLLGNLVAQAVQISVFIKRHRPERDGDIVLIKDTGMGPGSWFNYVFLPGAETDDAVLQHEIAHVRYGHSYDIILMRVIQCIAWANPVIWAIGKELKVVHEFQADAIAGRTEHYGSTLLNELFHTKHFALSHTFFHHPIKRRIMMLQTTRSHAGKMKVVTLSLVMIGGLLFVQCSKGGKQASVSATIPAYDSAAIAKKLYGSGLKIQPIGNTGFASITDQYDRAPKFEGDLLAYLGKNTVYPKAAKDKNIEGKVMMKFDVNETGELENIEVLGQANDLLARSATDVVKNMPRWKPGTKNGKPATVTYMLPISYKLN